MSKKTGRTSVLKNMREKQNSAISLLIDRSEGDTKLDKKDQTFISNEEDKTNTIEETVHSNKEQLKLGSYSDSDNKREQRVSTVFVKSRNSSDSEKGCSDSGVESELEHITVLEINPYIVEEKVFETEVNDEVPKIELSTSEEETETAIDAADKSAAGIQTPSTDRKRRRRITKKN